MPGTALSDHAPVSLKIFLEGFTGPRRGIGIPDSVFRLTKLSQNLEVVWYSRTHSNPTIKLAFALSTSALIARSHAEA